TPLTSPIYTLSLHDALPIWWTNAVYIIEYDAAESDPVRRPVLYPDSETESVCFASLERARGFAKAYATLNSVRTFVRRFDFLRRSEEHTSELQSRSDLVCRL